MRDTCIRSEQWLHQNLLKADVTICIHDFQSDYKSVYMTFSEIFICTFSEIFICFHIVCVGD